MSNQRIIKRKKKNCRSYSASVQEKRAVYLERLYLLQQRLARNPLFSRPVFGDLSERDFVEVRLTWLLVQVLESCILLAHHHSLLHSRMALMPCTVYHTVLPAASHFSISTMFHLDFKRRELSAAHRDQGSPGKCQPDKDSHGLHQSARRWPVLHRRSVRGTKSGSL